MKALILALQSTLRTVPGVKQRDVFVTEDIHLIRNAGGYPAVGIKDGGQNFTLLAGDQEEESLTVTLACYVQLLKPEAGIMGDGSRPGVLDLTADILGLLRGNNLGGAVEMVEPVDVSASELLLDDNLALVMSTVTLRYTRYNEI